MAYQFNQGDRPLPGYTIQRGVGRGGFGEVYYATSDGGKEIALKFLRENPQVELRGVAHCLNLKSPYLVALHDVKQNVDGDFFVVMEYVSGPSLRDLLTNEPDGLGTQKAAYFLREIGKGLAYLHDRGIVHRDLKPGNIFYEDGYVKIGDYGLAKIMAASQHSGQTVSVGTVHYMAPEVGSGNYDRTIDIYALGVILYEMLLGKVPFSGATMGEVLMKHLTAQPEVDALPAPFPRVIRKALEKDPKDRYQTVNEMIADVFATEDLDQSVAAFEPASLTMVANRVASDLRVEAGAPTLAAGGGRVGVLGTGSSNIGQAVPPPIVHPEAERYEGRFDRGKGRFSRQVGRVSHRIDGSAFGQHVARAGTAGKGRLGQCFIAFAVILCAGWLSMLFDGGGWYAGIAVVLQGICVTAGVTLGSRLGGRWVDTSSSWTQRFVNAAAVGAITSPLLFVLRELHVDSSGALIVLMIAMLLCDWPRRFLDGRAGHISLGSAFTAGLFGFFAGHAFSSGGFDFACILAAASIAVQAMAAIWPLSPEERTAYEEMCDLEAKDEDEEDEDWSESVGDAAGAAVNSGRAAAAVGEATVPSGGTRTRGTSKPVRVPRSMGVRMLWLCLSVVVLCLSIGAFIAPSYFKEIYGQDESFCYIGGVVGCCFSIFALCCSIRTYKAGFWRTYIRPGAFFGGLAFSAAAGMAIGLLNMEQQYDFFAIMGSVFGGLVALLVWVIPVAPYVVQEKPRQAKIVLPLRRIFEVDRGVNLPALLERHWTLYGYAISKRTDLLWSFVRGDWTAQWYQEDIRRWKTQLNVAAYELEGGGFRITCHLSVDAPFNKPNQTQVAQLDAELREFQELLSGREVSSAVGDAT